MLEAREVPAVLFWNPQPGLGLSASVAGNWSVGAQGGTLSLVAPGPTDDLFFTPVLTVAQPDNSGIIGGGTPGGPTSPPPTQTDISPNCVFDSASGSQFNSINLVSEYAGTVTFQHDIAVGGFTMTSGAIDQTGVSQSSALTFTVNAAYSTSGGSFTWNGGTLNSGLNAGVVSIVGITNATIGDGTDTSYTTGSDLKLLSGTILSASGSIVLNNGAGLEVGVLCQLKGQPEQPTIPPPPKKWVEILKGTAPVSGGNGHPITGFGYVLLKGEATGLGGTCAAPIFLDGGTLNVVNADIDVTEVFATDTLGQPISVENSSSVYMLANSKLNIRDGRTFKLNATGNGILMFGGLLTTQVEANKIDGTPEAVGHHIAFIDGKLVIKGGTVTVGDNDQTDSRLVGTLHVTGDIQFLGGTYKPHVFADDADKRDRWTTDKVFIFKPAAKIDSILHGTGGVGRAWEVIRAVQGFLGTDRPTVTVAADWELTEPPPADPGAPPAPRWIHVRKK